MRGRVYVPLLAVALALSSPAVAAPPKVPAVVKVRAGEITSVELECEPGKEAVWARGFAPEACYIDEGKPLRKDTLRLIVSPRAAGVYRVNLITVGEKEFSTLIIDAGVGPIPVPPGPTPDPPVPVPPVDPLATAVQAAYTADTSTTKAADVKALAAVYRATAEALGDIKTAGELFAVIRGATESRIMGRLKPTRGLFGAELEKVLPAEPATALTAQHKTDAAKQLVRFASFLEGVK